LGLRREPLLIGAVALAAAVYATLSLIRFLHTLDQGFDLGIFDQTIWHYSRFEIPENTVKGFSTIWGDHFSPILALLAPLFWIWDDARAVLIGQGVVLAAAAVPIFLYARDRLGRTAAYGFAIGYLCFWGVQSAVAFEFHELAFAPLAGAALLLAASRERWRLYFALLVALLCVKEDQSIVVVFIGLYLIAGGARRQGLATIAVGLAWYVLVIKLLIPHYNPDHEYPYWSYGQFGDDPLSAVGHAITHPGLVLDQLFGNATKRHTLLFLFAPLLFLSLFSRTAIILVPLVVQRFLSTKSAYWETDFHYTLAMTAFLFLGGVDGLVNLRRRLGDRAPRALVGAVAACVVVANIVCLAATERGPGGYEKLWDVLKPSNYRMTTYDKGARDALAVIPDGASVTAQTNLVPLLTHRKVIREITGGVPRTEYAAAQVLEPSARGNAVNGGFVAVSKFMNARLADSTPVAYAGGFLVLRDGAPLGPGRTEALPPLTGEPAARLREAATHWQDAELTYSGQLLKCIGGLRCPERLGAEVRVATADLARALASVRSQLRGSCTELEVQARTGLSTLSNGLEQLRLAIVAQDAARAQQAFTAVRSLRTRHPEGFVARFVGLCAP
jgi:uncharacterized membrane protein